MIELVMKYKAEKVCHEEMVKMPLVDLKVLETSCHRVYRRHLGLHEVKGRARVAFKDEFRAAEEIEVLCEAQQGQSGVKRKIFKSFRNKMGNEPILALPKGSDNFVVMREARAWWFCLRMLEALGVRDKECDLDGSRASTIHFQSEGLNMRQRRWMELFSDYGYETKTLIMEEAHGTKYFVRPEAEIGESKMIGLEMEQETTKLSFGDDGSVDEESGTLHGLATTSLDENRHKIGIKKLLCALLDIFVVERCDIQVAKAHVGDFGLARLLGTDLNQNRSTGVKGTIGYAPPEYGIGSEVTSSGDVYSFGILLLEVGKNPTDGIFIEGLSLHKFAYMALPDHVSDVIDDDAIVLQSTEANAKKVEECMAATIKIGVSCSVDSPPQRMKIEIVVNELKGDYYRYPAEFKSGNVKKEAANQSLKAYQLASTTTEADLSPTNHIRLGLTLNFFLFYYKNMNPPERPVTRPNKLLIKLSQSLICGVRNPTKIALCRCTSFLSSCFVFHLVSSIAQVVGVILCLNTAAKISHRAQGIAALASRWHALASCGPDDRS
nr:protein kinase-like domain-containing protein [Tanacetum cinerariifolium]